MSVICWDGQKLYAGSESVNSGKLTYVTRTAKLAFTTEVDGKPVPEVWLIAYVGEGSIEAMQAHVLARFKDKSLSEKLFRENDNTARALFIRYTDPKEAPEVWYQDTNFPLKLTPRRFEVHGYEEMEFSVGLELGHSFEEVTAVVATQSMYCSKEFTFVEVTEDDFKTHNA